MKEKTPINFTIPLVFGEKHQCQIEKVFKYNQRWEVLTKAELLDLKISDLFNVNGRFCIEGKLNDGQVFRVVSFDEDYQQVRFKFPNDLAIHLSQLYKIFQKTCDIETALPRILLPLGILNASIMGDSL